MKGSAAVAVVAAIAAKGNAAVVKGSAAVAFVTAIAAKGNAAVAANSVATFAVHPAFHAAYRAPAAAYRVVRVNGKFQSR